jgi:hypothetical protein
VQVYYLHRAATNAIGPNNSGSQTTSSASNVGDADLDALIPGFMTYDAAVLEFDIVATEPTIEFKYVFGSEEYLEFVGTNFNDVFGFFIGAIGDPLQNIAFIPDTTVVVSINNVNDLPSPSTISIMAMALRLRKTPTHNMCNTMV